MVVQGLVQIHDLEYSDMQGEQKKRSKGLVLEFPCYPQLCVSSLQWWNSLYTAWSVAFIETHVDYIFKNTPDVRCGSWNSRGIVSEPIL